MFGCIRQGLCLPNIKVYTTLKCSSNVNSYLHTANIMYELYIPVLRFHGSGSVKCIFTASKNFNISIGTIHLPWHHLHSLSRSCSNFHRMQFNTSCSKTLQLNTLRRSIHNDRKLKNCELLKISIGQQQGKYYSTKRDKREEVRKKKGDESRIPQEDINTSRDNAEDVRIKAAEKNRKQLEFSESESESKEQSPKDVKKTEVRKKIAERNKRLREQLEASEIEWESKLNMSLLGPEDVKIYETHKAAVAHGHFTYDDPVTGYRVMTRLRHFWRGSCCGNACRHCIYNHDNVAESEKLQRVFNSAFWVDAAERPDLRTMLTTTATSIDNEKRNKYTLSQRTLKTHISDGGDDEDDNVDPLLFKH